MTGFLLHGFADGGEAKAWAVGEGRPHILGRAADAHIRTNSSNVGKRQARVGIDGDGPWVEDAQSPGGTFVDSGSGPRHIGRARVHLAHGHRIVCGAQAWTVDCLRDPAAGPLGASDLGAGADLGGDVATEPRSVSEYSDSLLAPSG